MKARIDVDKIAKGLGAERRGRVIAPGGYFGAVQLVADVEARFRIPKGGGRPTVAEWTTKRVLPLSEETLKRLERLAKRIFRGETWPAPALQPRSAVARHPARRFAISSRTVGDGLIRSLYFATPLESLHELLEVEIRFPLALVKRRQILCVLRQG